MKDVEKSCDFYEKIIGMEVISFNGNRRALKFGNQKINLHKYQNESSQKANFPTPGPGDLCFIVGDSIPYFITHLEIKGVSILEGSVKKTGAMGSINSIYIRDPDSNFDRVI